MARYIDAERLKEKRYYDSKRHEYCVSIAEVDWQPTADVQEVKHGKWEHNYPICSNCGHLIAVDLSHAKEFYHYCPNCGAKMDKE